MESTTCHFCDAAHSFDLAGVTACRPKRRFRGAFQAALAAGVPGHPADCDCVQCEGVRVSTLLGRVFFLGEPPNRQFVGALLARLKDEPTA